MNRTAVIAMLGLAVTGCSSAPPLTHEPYVKPGLILVTADQAARYGVNIAGPTAVTDSRPKDVQPLDSSAVIAPPGVKVYTLNRAVDPADRELMHEEHVVYRRESTPQWRLDVPAEQKILVGPRVSDGRQELQPLLSKELTGYLADQRRATDANQKAITALFQAIDALSRQQEELIRHEVGKKPAPNEPISVEQPGPRETDEER